MDGILIRFFFHTIIFDIFKGFPHRQFNMHAINVFQVLYSLLELKLGVFIMNLDCLLIRGEQNKLFKQLETVRLSIIAYPTQLLKHFSSCLQGMLIMFKSMKMRRMVQERKCVNRFLIFLRNRGEVQLVHNFLLYKTNKIISRR